MSLRRAFVDRVMGTRPGPPRGAIIFANQVGTHPVLVEIRSPISTFMDVIHIRDPTDFNYEAVLNAIQDHATTSSTMFPPLAAGMQAPKIVTSDLKVSWNLGDRAMITGVPTDVEFRRCFAMMSYRGWTDYFKVRVHRDGIDPELGDSDGEIVIGMKVESEPRNTT